MKFGFVTCVQLGLACMDEIYRAGGRLDLAMTLPDDRAAAKSGRVYIDDFCTERGIPLVKTRNVNDLQAIEAVRTRGIDWLFIIGWSQIAREEMLQAPRKGAIGMHPTLLPRGRGRASIPWAILKGLDRTGVTMFQLDSGVDTGPILAQLELPLAADETATQLYQRVAEAHRLLIARVWKDLESGRLQAKPQDASQASVWPGRKPEDGRIDVHMTCQEVERLVRAVTRPYPGAFLDAAGKRYRIWSGRMLPQAPSEPVREKEDGLLLGLKDGGYQATEWEAGEIPQD